jgi:hypothetical protein
MRGGGYSDLFPLRFEENGRGGPCLEAAYSLHNRVFMENLRTILLYAVIGTIINFILIGEDLSLSIFLNDLHIQHHLYFYWRWFLQLQYM